MSAHALAASAAETTLAAPAAEMRLVDPSRTACFSVQAQAHPGIMPRVLALFAKRGLVPTSWHSRVGGPRDDELTIDIQMSGLARAESDYIAACLRQIPAVDCVLTSERYSAAAE